MEIERFYSLSILEEEDCLIWYKSFDSALCRTSQYPKHTIHNAAMHTKWSFRERIYG